MSKQLVFDVEARRHLKTGVDVLAEAVKTTLGPKGATWRWTRASVRLRSATTG